jgi:hypothetical protein
MLHSSVHYKLWGEAVIFSNYITNILPTNTLKSHTLYSILKSKHPDISHILFFSCKSQVLIQHKHLSKFNSKTKKLIHVGVNTEGAGYRL